MNVFTLIFGKSIYKTSLNTYDGFNRYNSFKTLGKAVLVIAITALLYKVLYVDTNTTTAPVILIFVLAFLLYKVIACTIRYFRKTYPIYGNEYTYKTDRRFKTGQRQTGSYISEKGREVIKEDQLPLHKNQQLARIIYHLVLCTVILVLVFVL